MADHSTLPARYDHAEVEPRRYAQWERSGVFHEEPDPARPAFIISMPPPNITGRAHLGHGSTYTPMDILTRYHRMLGENADWLPGQDHAAIATEAVLVRELAREGLTRDGLGREAYLERAWRWRTEYGGVLYDQFRKLGFGPDWDRDRFTMDAALSRAVMRVFVSLYEAGLIYRGTRLVNWDVVGRTTISDAEIESEEREGSLWFIRYRTDDGGDGIVVATTRPETMLGDVAIAVHPEDERYAALVGRNVILPLIERPIPIIADASVKREFGTGAVKVTPAHDPNDYEIGRRHDLAMPTVIDADGRMTGDVGAYAGLERFEARAAIVRDLAVRGALERIKAHPHQVPVSSRSGAVIEPLLSLQWFCTMAPLAEPALAAYREGRIRFHPERFGRTFESGLSELRDWNISRQVWWGHQLPVWYTPDNAIVVAESEEEARTVALERHGTTDVRRDPDTLDTWFSSGLWPFSILGWPDATPELRDWYPNQVLITGRDIIFLWISRMVMLGLRFAGDVPFRDVFIAPLVFDMHGRKMSKSLGNAIDPLDLIAEYGADGLRFGIVRQMRLESQELRFDERFCDEAKRFATKLWNATRYAHSLPEGLPRAGTLPPADDLSIADRWVLTRLRECVLRVSEALDAYEFGVAADALIDFGWYEMCDWYLEATKAPGAERTRAAVLSFVMNAFVRALHPIAPFVTEEIWLALPHDGKTVVTASWPDIAEMPSFAGDALRFNAVRTAVERLRNARAEIGLNPRQRMTVTGPALDEPIVVQLRIHANVDYRVDESTNGLASADLAERLAAIQPEAPAGVLRERYARDVARFEDEVTRLEKKLANDGFVARAKPDVVAREREKLDGYRRDLERSRAALAALGDER